MPMKATFLMGCLCAITMMNLVGCDALKVGTPSANTNTPFYVGYWKNAGDNPHQCATLQGEQRASCESRAQFWQDAEYYLTQDTFFSVSSNCLELNGFEFRVRDASDTQAVLLVKNPNQQANTSHTPEANMTLTYQKNGEVCGKRVYKGKVKQQCLAPVTKPRCRYPKRIEDIPADSAHIAY